MSKEIYKKLKSDLAKADAILDEHRAALNKAFGKPSDFLENDFMRVQLEFMKSIAKGLEKLDARIAEPERIVGGDNEDDFGVGKAKFPFI